MKKLITFNKPEYFVSNDLVVCKIGIKSLAKRIEGISIMEYPEAGLKAKKSLYGNMSTIFVSETTYTGICSRKPDDPVDIENAKKIALKKAKRAAFKAVKNAVLDIGCYYQALTDTILDFAWSLNGEAESEDYEIRDVLKEISIKDQLYDCCYGIFSNGKCFECRSILDHGTLLITEDGKSYLVSAFNRYGYNSEADISIKYISQTAKSYYDIKKEEAAALNF